MEKAPSFGLIPNWLSRLAGLLQSSWAVTIERLAFPPGAVADVPAPPALGALGPDSRRDVGRVEATLQREVGVLLVVLDHRRSDALCGRTDKLTCRGRCNDDMPRETGMRPRSSSATG